MGKFADQLHITSDFDKALRQYKEALHKLQADVEELNRLADTQITLSSLQAKRHKRVILFFDTFEQLAAVATPWLLDYFWLLQIITVPLNFGRIMHGFIQVVVEPTVIVKNICNQLVT